MKFAIGKDGVILSIVLRNQAKKKVNAAFQQLKRKTSQPLLGARLLTLALEKQLAQRFLVTKYYRKLNGAMLLSKVLGKHGGEEETERLVTTSSMEESPQMRKKPKKIQWKGSFGLEEQQRLSNKKLESDMTGRFRRSEESYLDEMQMQSPVEKLNFQLME